jgi:hypothetical protein
VIRFRPAGPDDADDIAALHADSWRRVETAPVPPPGGDPARLNGQPLGLRMVWSFDQAGSPIFANAVRASSRSHR